MIALTGRVDIFGRGVDYDFRAVKRVLLSKPVLNSCLVERYGGVWCVNGIFDYYSREAGSSHIVGSCLSILKALPEVSAVV